VRYRGGFCVSCDVKEGWSFRENDGRQVSLSSVYTESAAECVKKTVTPGDQVQKSLYKPLPLSRDMKQKNVIGVVAWSKHSTTTTTTTPTPTKQDVYPRSRGKKIQVTTKYSNT
jgi:hypothetical protein